MVPVGEVECGFALAFSLLRIQSTSGAGRLRVYGQIRTPVRGKLSLFCSCSGAEHSVPPHVGGYRGTTLDRCQDGKRAGTFPQVERHHWVVAKEADEADRRWLLCDHCEWRCGPSLAHTREPP